MGITLVILTLAILIGLTQAIDAPVSPNVAYESNLANLYDVNVMVGDQLTAEIFCAGPATDVYI